MRFYTKHGKPTWGGYPHGSAGIPNCSQKPAGYGKITSGCTVTMAKLAIALAMAIPSYSSYVIRAKRTEAIQGLEAAACQERLYARLNAYDATACTGQANDNYLFSITTSNGNFAFIATAAPQGSQLEDECGAISIDETGAKKADGHRGADSKQEVGADDTAAT